MLIDMPTCEYSLSATEQREFEPVAWKTNPEFRNSLSCYRLVGYRQISLSAVYEVTRAPVYFNFQECRFGSVGKDPGNEDVMHSQHTKQRFSKTTVTMEYIDPPPMDLVKVTRKPTASCMQVLTSPACLAFHGLWRRYQRFIWVWPWLFSVWNWHQISILNHTSPPCGLGTLWFSMVEVFLV